MEARTRRTAVADREQRSRALREKSARARARGDVIGMLDAWYRALALERNPRWIELMRVGQLLNMQGARAQSVACFRRAMSMERHAIPAARFLAGRDPEALVIGFTVFNGTMSGHKTNFFGAAGLTGCDRLKLWDSRFQMFLGGLPPVAEGYAGLLAYLEGEIARRAPRRLIVTGSSGSGFAALLYGHALGADAAYAFSPAVCLDAGKVADIEPQTARTFGPLLAELTALPLPDPAVLDLREVLRRDNGKSRYYVHYGAENELDASRARLLADCPGVTIAGHPTARHMVAEWLAEAGLLRAAFARGAEGGRPRPARPPW
jgi:hypothetical protein